MKRRNYGIPRPSPRRQIGLQDPSSHRFSATVRRLLLALAHELRNPLAGILARLGALRARLEKELRRPARASPVRHSYTTGILRELLAIERMLMRVIRLVDSVFDSALLLNDELVVEKEGEISLAEVISDLFLEMSTLYPERTLVADLPPELPELVGERARLEQVLACTLHNACRYSPVSGAVGVRARVHDLRDKHRTAPMEPLPSEPQETSERIGRSLVPQLYVHIEIWDQGPGIPAAERERVFQPFYRLRRDTEKFAGPGLGLGLYICQGMVRSHGGAIWIGERSTEGEATGTVIHVLWPAVARGKVPADGKGRNKPARS